MVVIWEVVYTEKTIFDSSIIALEILYNNFTYAQIKYNMLESTQLYIWFQSAHAISIMYAWIKRTAGLIEAYYT